MSKFSLRCRVDACRHRRVSRTHPDAYVRPPRCEACGSMNGWRVEERAYNKRGLCRCGGPVGRDGPIPHRTSHPLCDHHPNGPANQMRRAGADEIDVAYDVPATPGPDEPPF